MLELRPIRSTDAVILFAEEYYSPVETFEKETLAKTLLIRTKQGGKAYKWIGGKLLVADSQNKEVPFEVISKHRIQIAGENMDDYDTYELCDKEIELLTNQTLLNLKNPPLFDGKYRCKLPVQQSTYEHLYFLPKEMTIRDVLNHFSLCGFRIPEESAIVVKDYFAQSVIDHSKTLGELS